MGRQEDLEKKKEKTKDQVQKPIEKKKTDRQMKRYINNGGGTCILERNLLGEIRMTM